MNTILHCNPNYANNHVVLTLSQSYHFQNSLNFINYLHLHLLYSIFALRTIFRGPSSLRSSNSAHEIVHNTKIRPQNSGQSSFLK